MSDDILIRDKRDAHWFWLDNEILDAYGSRIKPQGIALYCALARHAGNKSQECWPSIATLARETGMSARSVQNYIKTLQSEGLISVEPGEHENGTSSPNVYTLLSLKKQEVSEKPIVREDAGGAPSNERKVQEVHREVAGGAIEPNLSEPDMGAIWDSVLSEIALQTTQENYSRWFVGSRLVDLDPDWPNRLTVQCHDAYSVDGLSSRWAGVIARTLRKVTGNSEISIEFAISPAAE
jgi:DNA-binding MarR family transcriptional regulator